MKNLDKIIPNFENYGIKWTNAIRRYRNNSNKKCVNEFEKIVKIDEGAVWRVYSAFRYFYNEEKSIEKSFDRLHVGEDFELQVQAHDERGNLFSSLDQILFYTLFHLIPGIKLEQQLIQFLILIVLIVSYVSTSFSFFCEMA